MTWRPPVAAAVLSSLACLEYSPHATSSAGSARDLHAQAVERLRATPPPDPLRFALIGDTQLHLDQTRHLVDDLGARDDVAFAVQLGDLTHNGLAIEYRTMHDLLGRLPVPYFVAIGNHDLLANGGDLYAAVYGPRDFAFTHGRTRFVLHDNNAVERGFDGTAPDLAFLAAALAPGPDHDQAFVFSHCDPQSGDFDPALREPFFALLRDLGVSASFHAHSHSYAEREVDGVSYYVADAVDERTYLVVTVHAAGGFEVERVPF
jgi:3',5'-cyclic AMP phosphodiesterase CpdA